MVFAAALRTFHGMSPIDELRTTMARLRGKNGCPWDQEQTHQSLARCLIDECSELLETIDEGDMPHMREELGDVLIQVVFHALLAEEAGHFNFDDVAADINAKLVRRHPHVFGSEKLGTSDQVIAQWEVIKAGERAARGGGAGVGPHFQGPAAAAAVAPPCAGGVEADWTEAPARRWVGR